MILNTSDRNLSVISDPCWYNPHENVLLIDWAICLSIVFLSISGQSFFFQCSMCVCLNHLYLCLRVTNLCAELKWSSFECVCDYPVIVFKQRFGAYWNDCVVIHLNDLYFSFDVLTK